eukprot:scaffold20241_cov73-Isochrysis_galbana.AAC.1
MALSNGRLRPCASVRALARPSGHVSSCTSPAATPSRALRRPEKVTNEARLGCERKGVVTVGLGVNGNW